MSTNFETDTKVRILIKVKEEGGARIKAANETVKTWNEREVWIKTGKLN